jgi:hypothetical protein
VNNQQGLVLGSSITPRVIVKVYNKMNGGSGDEYLGSCVTSISAVLSNCGQELSEWSTLKKDNGLGCGSVLLKMQFKRTVDLLLEEQSKVRRKEIAIKAKAESEAKKAVRNAIGKESSRGSSSNSGTNTPLGAQQVGGASKEFAAYKNLAEKRYLTLESNKSEISDLNSQLTKLMKERDEAMASDRMNQAEFKAAIAKVAAAEFKVVEMSTKMNPAALQSIADGKAREKALHEIEASASRVEELQSENVKLRREMKKLEVVHDEERMQAAAKTAEVARTTSTQKKKVSEGGGKKDDLKDGEIAKLRTSLDVTIAELSRVKEEHKGGRKGESSLKHELEETKKLYDSLRKETAKEEDAVLTIAVDGIMKDICNTFMERSSGSSSSYLRGARIMFGSANEMKKDEFCETLIDLGVFDSKLLRKVSRDRIMRFLCSDDEAVSWWKTTSESAVVLIKVFLERLENMMGGGGSSSATATATQRKREAPLEKKYADADFDGTNNLMPPLPPGWEERMRVSDGKIYFVDRVRKKTQWERPGV